MITGEVKYHWWVGHPSGDFKGTGLWRVEGYSNVAGVSDAIWQEISKEFPEGWAEQEKGLTLEYYPVER